jgi:hypothetical protein
VLRAGLCESRRFWTGSVSRAVREKVSSGAPRLRAALSWPESNGFVTELSTGVDQLRAMRVRYKGHTVRNLRLQGGNLYPRYE